MAMSMLQPERGTAPQPTTTRRAMLSMLQPEKGTILQSTAIRMPKSTLQPGRGTIPQPTAIRRAMSVLQAKKTRFKIMAMAMVTKTMVIAVTPKLPSVSVSFASRGCSTYLLQGLDPKVIGKGFAQNGQQNLTEPNQVASLTSTNNFINFCIGTNQQITNGQQVQSGSCNPIPMGSIPSTQNMPASKFQSPKNLDVVKAKTTFNVTMKIQGLTTGFFVNAESNYYSAPQQLDKTGKIVGHSHVVIQQMTSLDSTELLDPKTFAFFKGLNDAAQGGVLSAEVTGGLPSGAYRVASINTAANHQPCLAPVAQHGSLDDQAFVSSPLLLECRIII
jgi:hypothetical protein